uniref:BACK domain-containing protein n=1 Tax=Strongyloides papillosus TaxID=174720 RepID=A0A0N5BVG4_STREA
MSENGCLSTACYLKSEASTISTTSEDPPTNYVGRTIYNSGMEISWDILKSNIKIINNNYVNETKKMENGEKNSCENFIKVILSTGEEMDVSKRIFGHNSFYIQRLVSQNTSEKLVIKSTAFDPIALKKIFCYMSYGILEYTLHEVGEIIRVAGSFEMYNIMNDIETSLISFGSFPSNILGRILTIASHEDYLITIKTKKIILKLVNNNLYKFLQSNEFLLLSPSAVVRLLSYDDLNVIDEVEVFRMAMYYLIYGKNQLYADSILNCVRFQNMNNIEMKAIYDISEAYNDLYIKKILGYYIEDYLLYQKNGIIKGEVRNMNMLCIRNKGNGNISIVMKILEKKTLDDVKIHIS